MTQMEQRTGKKVSWRTEVLFVLCGLGFFFFLPLGRGWGGNAFHQSTHKMHKNPLLWVDYCIMHDSIFKLG